MTRSPPEEPRHPDPQAIDDPEPDANTISPLPGEPGIPNVAVRSRGSMSKKGLLAAALLIGSLIAVSALTIQRFVAGSSKSGNDAKPMRDKPAAASTDPRKLEMPARPPAGAAIAPSPHVPALAPLAEEMAEPIGVRRTGSGAPASGNPKAVPPEDAPVMLVSTRPSAPNESTGVPTRTVDASTAPGDPEPSLQPGQPSDPMAATSRNLQGYQRQLQGLLDNLTQAAALTSGHTPGQTSSGALLRGHPTGGPALGEPSRERGGPFGRHPQGGTSASVAASMSGERSLLLPKGTAFTCALTTKVISAASGPVGCQVQRNVFSEDGRVLLIERGSHLDGEYRVASVKPGTVRIPVLWTRIRTPLGVTVDIDSPGTGQLGEAGIDGYVDNRWSERIGAAMLLSLIDDSVKLVIQNQANESQGNTVVLPSTTANTSKLAEKVLDSTINISPLIYQNQGGIVGIVVARDVDFSSVYELKPEQR